MGLDITAHRRLYPPTSIDPLADGCYIAENDGAFAARSDGIPTGCIYAGCAEEYHFRAGSYSGYNHWREQLAQLAGYPAAEDGTEPTSRFGHTHSAGAWAAKSGPFWELITFSDCEGTIGPVTSAKLARDFALHQDAADAHPEECFRHLYREWRHAFELAEHGGAVVFA
jgi:hypothetical protein